MNPTLTLHHTSLEHYRWGFEYSYDVSTNTSEHWCLTHSGRWFLVLEDRHGHYTEQRRLSPSEAAIAERHRPDFSAPAPSAAQLDTEIALVCGEMLSAADPAAVLGPAPEVLLTLDRHTRRPSSSPTPMLLPADPTQPQPVAPPPAAVAPTPPVESPSSSPPAAPEAARLDGGRAPILQLVRGA